MIFDFITNRVLFILGMIVLIVLTSIMSSIEEISPFFVVLLAFIFVFIINFLMKRVASGAYRHINELLFYYGDAEGYLKHMSVLYHRGSRKRRPVIAIKMQNLIMANVFAGDLETARKLNQDFTRDFEPELANQSSLQFSQLMIDCLINLFEYNTEQFEITHQSLRQGLEKFDEPTRKYIEENPYSVYYMINKLSELLSEYGTIDSENFHKEQKEMNEFLKTCIVYGLLKQAKLISKEEVSFEKAPGNTLFFLDETVKL